MKVTRSCIYKLNNKGDKGRPCFRPVLTLNQSVRLPFNLIEHCTLALIYLITEQPLSATPNVLSFFHNIFLFMVSYAFFKSITAQQVGLRSFFLTSIILEMPVPSQGHYGFHSFPVVD
jgi:hypothetical protein